MAAFNKQIIWLVYLSKVSKKFYEIGDCLNVVKPSHCSCFWLGGVFEKKEEEKKQQLHNNFFILLSGSNLEYTP